MSIRNKIGNIVLMLLGVALAVSGWFMYKIESPAFQTQLTQKVLAYLSQQVKSEFSVGKVQIKFFNSIVLNNVLIRDQRRDTLIGAGKIEASFSIVSLLQSKYSVSSIYVNGAHVYLHRLPTDSDWNYQFLLDAFGGGGSSGGNSETALALDLGSVKLQQTHFVMDDGPNNVLLDFSVPVIRIDVRKLDLQQPSFTLKRLILDRPDLRVAKTVRQDTDTADDTADPDANTAIVHINTKSIRLFVEDLKLVDAHFTYDDRNEGAATGQFDGVHEYYSHLNLHFTNSSLVLDTIKAHVADLSAEEKSGFALQHLEADVKVTPTEARADNLKITTPYSTAGNFFSFTYTNFHAFLDFNSEVVLTAALRQADVAIKDLNYFIPGLKGINEKVLADGNVHGTVDNMKATALTLQSGNNTRFAGNVELRGLPDIDETFIDLKVSDLFTNAADLKAWIPGVKLPDEVKRLGNTRFKGSFSGFIHDFVAYGTFNTRLGQVSSDLNMKFEEGAEGAQYSGNISTSGFQLGSLIDEDSLIGSISFAMNVKGTGLDVNHMNANMSGKVQQFLFRGYNYQNAVVDGNLANKVFTGSVNLNDPNLRLAFNGKVDFNPALPVYNFKAQVDSARLDQLLITGSPMMVSAKMDMNMSGNNLDDFLGKVKAADIVFSDKTARWRLDSLQVLIENKAQGNGRELLLTSPLAQAWLDGNFALTRLPYAFMSVIDYYFPSLPGNYPVSDTLQDFDFRIALNNIQGVEKFFMPALRGMDSTLIKGHFNSANHYISFLGTVPDLGFRNFEFGNVNVSAETKLDSFRFSAGSHDLQFSDSLSVVNPAVTLSLYHDVATLAVNGASPGHENYVNVMAKITSDSSHLLMHFLPSDLVLNGRRWLISQDNEVTYAGERLVFNNFSLTSESRKLTVDNINLRVRATNLQFGFQNIPLKDLHEFITWNNMVFDGNLNGTLQVLNVFHSPRFTAATSISDFSVNGSKVNQVMAGVSYQPEKDEMDLNVMLKDSLYDVTATGAYFPRRVTDVLNIAIDLRKADPALMQAMFFEGLISDTHGQASGQLYITGTPQAPQLTGEVAVASLSTRINYLQTTYRCANATVLFKDNVIELGDVTLYDEMNNTAKARGEIYHDHLDDWRMNVSITTNEFLAMNTTVHDNSLFYGTAVAKGIIQFLGPVDQMEIRASVTSLKGTNMSIPVSESASVSEGSFIQYINKKKDTTAVALPSGYERMTGLTMNFNMDITPDAIIQIIFDQATGDIIKGSGSGNIRMEINTKGDFNMYGTVTIEKGNYLFTQFNFFNKYFTIEQGGTLTWNGDPYNATIAISAIYSTKASLLELVPSSSLLSDEERHELQQRYSVDLYLKLSGSLFSPDITFDMQLPEVSSVSSAASVELMRLKQDQNELNKQAFGILVLGHFLPLDNTNLGSQSIGTTGINSLSGFISSQINALASQVRNDIDFTVNYQAYEANLDASDPNNLAKRNELQLALTKRFLNDRLAIDVGGNFDFGEGNTSEQTNQTNSGVAGDFSAEYKITPDGRVSGKVYSTSDYDVVDERNKVRNGIAIKYTREFDTLRELLKNTEKKKRRQDHRKEKGSDSNLPPE